MSYQPRKPGLYDGQIAKAWASRAFALRRQVADVSEAYRNDPAFTKVPVGFVFPELRDARRQVSEQGNNAMVAHYQNRNRRNTERGDFTHLSGRGI